MFQHLAQSVDSTIMKRLFASLVLAVAPAPQPATLTEINENPVAWRGVPVELVIQFQAPLESWRPWLTRFDERRYKGYSAWGDEQLLWKPRDFASPAMRLFARRGSQAEKAFVNAPLYRRFRITAVVRNIFESTPWIEILEAELLDRSIGQGTLIHAGRALVHKKEGRHAAAIEQYGRALAAPMPSAMKAALESERNAIQVPQELSVRQGTTPL